LAAFCDDWSSDAFERVTFNLDILHLLMFSNKIWKFLNIIVNQSQHIKVLHEMYHCHWNFLNFVSSDVKHFNVCEPASAKGSNTSDFVHVHVQLL